MVRFSLECGKYDQREVLAEIKQIMQLIFLFIHSSGQFKIPVLFVTFTYII